MTSPSTDKVVVAGVEPWLPWPLSAWSWWTRPVPAERLAILRIGLSLCLLVDLWFNYLPHLHDFFGAGGLGDPELFVWYGQSPRWNWSLLRGLADPLLLTLVFVGWALATAWLGLDLLARLTGDTTGPGKPQSVKLVLAWDAASILLILCVWSRCLGDNDAGSVPSLVPLGILALAAAFVLFEACRLLRTRSGNESRAMFWSLLAICGVFAGLAFVGMLHLPHAGPDSVARRLLGSWQREPVLLQTAFWIWFGATLGLLLGVATRYMAIAAWTLSVSFAHVNPYIDNAGDVVRGIILFYLMLCPCGAAWSIDTCLRRWRNEDQRTVFVSPWALRLLFVQMSLIYFLNGLFKLFGTTWLTGESLYLVLGDLNLIRFPHDRINLPYSVSVAMTWFMLGWEVGFPLWVALPWTRTLALIFGALFHVGILLTMELGGFAPYMLTLYLPLLPLKRWRHQDDGS
ncbi:MAG: HTTM domain-containing protein [Planctomycetes bacterium]|nr:HTTM domain-containing protein [Planctomycetota bacterium]